MLLAEATPIMKIAAALHLGGFALTASFARVAKKLISAACCSQYYVTLLTMCYSC